MTLQNSNNDKNMVDTTGSNSSEQAPRKNNKPTPAAIVKVTKDQVNELIESSKLVPSDWRKQDEVFGLFDSDELQLGRLMGTGGFSNVYEILGFDLKEGSEVENDSEKAKERRRLKESATDKDGKSTYVVKHIKLAAVSHPKEFCMAAADLIVEAQYLSCLDHENILGIHGWSLHGVDSYLSGCDDGNFLILDRLEETLEQRIKQWRKAEDEAPTFLHFHACMERRREQYRRATDVAHQIAKGLEYLHSKNMVFRDLKPDNVGFDKNGVVKLFDFGLARELPQVDHTELDVYKMSGKIGTVRYMAPEVALCKVYNQKVDTYSWSILYWYCLTLEKPYGDFNRPTHLYKVCQVGERPSLARFSDDIRNLLRNSWEQNVRKRLTISKVCGHLEHVKTTLLADQQRAPAKEVSSKSGKVSSIRRFPKFIRRKGRSVINSVVPTAA